MVGGEEGVFEKRKLRARGRGDISGRENKSEKRNIINTSLYFSETQSRGAGAARSTKAGWRAPWSGTPP